MSVRQEALRMDLELAIAALAAISCAASAASRFNGQLGATTAMRIALIMDGDANQRQRSPGALM